MNIRNESINLIASNSFMNSEKAITTYPKLTTMYMFKRFDTFFE